MGSILTNTGAMVALQTLKSVNTNMEGVQSQISTGKDVATAKDNAAVWAISKVMESDVKGFEGISDSLGLGESTVAVASSAAETVTDLLTDIKGKIVAAQESNVDREKIQSDIVELRDQIASVVGAAQFNGLNLLSNKDHATNGSSEVNVLASLDRSVDGVTASDITVVKQDLGLEEAQVGAVDDAASAGAVAVDATVDFFQIDSVSAVLANTAGNYFDDEGINAGQSFQISGVGTDVFSEAVTYVAREGDTVESVMGELITRANAQATLDQLDVEFSVSTTSPTDTIAVTNNGSAALTVVAGDASQTNVTAVVAEADAGTIGGGLELLSSIDVSTELGAGAALELVEGMINTAIDSAAAFGSAAGRIETQMDFVSTLTDALESGIGTLVDADMEEASARLQALQVQQQLAVQALSIANQQPQTLLSLFR